MTAQQIVRLVSRPDVEQGNRPGFSRPNNVCKMSVRLSTKSFLDFSDIWYVGRGRMVDE